MNNNMKSLIDELKNQQGEYSGKETFREKAIQLWKEEIDSFFIDVKKWLQPLVDEKLASILEKTFEIYEESNIYNATFLEIQIRGTHIKLEPIGTFLIGATGRIDLLVDGYKTNTFVLVDKKIEYPRELIKVKENTLDEDILLQEQKENSELEWKIRPSSSDNPFRTLSEETFVDLIKQLVL